MMTAFVCFEDDGRGQNPRNACSVKKLKRKEKELPFMTS
jgi:hypothetical protein